MPTRIADLPPGSTRRVPRPANLAPRGAARASRTGDSGGGFAHDDEICTELDRCDGGRVPPGPPEAGQFLQREVREAGEARPEALLGERANVASLVVRVELGQGTRGAKLVHGHGDAEPPAGAEHGEERCQRRVQIPDVLEHAEGPHHIELLQTEDAARILDQALAELTVREAI